ncbi:MAG: TIGR01777 family oxidoreductase [bacterium]
MVLTSGNDMNGKHIILAGGSGFIGSALTQRLLSGGARVTVLTRSDRIAPQAGVRYVVWDGRSRGPWTEVLEGADALVNFSGRNVNCRLTPRNKRELLTSRLEALKVLGEAVSRCRHEPGVFVHCSAVGFYGDTGRSCNEEAPAGSGMLADITKTCEAAINGMAFTDTRKVVLRLGVVFGREGGALPVLARLTRCFLGGAAGNGRQGVSWIHLQDLNRVFCEVLENAKLNGVFNAVTPQPITNAELMQTLRRVLNRPWSPPVPAWLLRTLSLVVGINPELILTGKRCLPTRLQQAGFEFEYQDLESALQNLLGVGS